MPDIAVLVLDRPARPFLSRHEARLPIMNSADSGRSQRLAVLLVAACLALLLAVALVFGVAPTIAAAACPSCAGFAKLERGVYIERGATASERAAAAAFVAVARRRVAAFYGGLDSRPRILICESERCYQRIGGGSSTGMALMSFALVLSPRGSNPVIASHEMAHIELHTRLGAGSVAPGTVPQWFNEGLSVVISGDPRYLASPGTADRCLVAPDGPMPIERAAWVAEERARRLYAKAGCRVSRWLSRRGGGKAVLQLIARMRAGARFDAAFEE